MDSIKKNLEKVGSSLYNLFDHLYIKIIIITILVIYNSGLFIDYNLYLSSVFNNTIIRLIILLIIVGIANKNITIALLLILTLAISSYYKAENFETMEDQDNDKKNKKERKEENRKEKKEKFTDSQFVKRETFVSRRM
jgi:cytochrome b subunit of formate dehydrogenase